MPKGEHAAALRIIYILITSGSLEVLQDHELRGLSAVQPPRGCNTGGPHETWAHRAYEPCAEAVHHTLARLSAQNLPLPRHRRICIRVCGSEFKASTTALQSPHGRWCKDAVERKAGTDSGEREVNRDERMSAPAGVSSQLQSSRLRSSKIDLSIVSARLEHGRKKKYRLRGRPRSTLLQWCGYP